MAAVRPKREKVTHYEQVFLVQGSGKFPFDMLRYDTCIPATESDAAKLDGRGEREIRIKRFTVNPTHGPTFGRWQSFGWKITAEVV